MRLTIPTVTRRLKACGPENESQVLRECRIPLEYIDEGEYRAVFTIPGLPLVLKVPRIDSRDCFDHARHEWGIWNDIMTTRELKHLRRYMPKVYYFGWDTGVTLMHRYKLLKGRGSKATRKQMEKVFADTLDLECADCEYNPGNVGVDSCGNPVLIDLGYLTGEYGT